MSATFWQHMQLSRGSIPDGKVVVETVLTLKQRAHVGYVKNTPYPNGPAVILPDPANIFL